MKSNYKVSIIVTSYNMGEYLKETINSVMKQTYNNKEVIVVDDGSNDDRTISELNELAECKEIRVIRIPNSGVSVARNIGVEASTGEYLVFLDGDDLIEESYVERCIKVFQNDSTIEMVYSISKLFGAVKRIRPLDTPKYNKLLVYNNYFSVTCMLLKKRFLEVNGFNSRMRYGIEDWEFFIRYCYEGMIVCRINKVLFFYRIRKVSRTKQINSSVKRTLQMRLEILENNIDIYSKYRDSLRKHRLVVDDRNTIITNLRKILNLLKLLMALCFRNDEIERFIL